MEENVEYKEITAIFLERGNQEVLNDIYLHLDFDNSTIHTKINDKRFGANLKELKEFSLFKLKVEIRPGSQITMTEECSISEYNALFNNALFSELLFSNLASNQWNGGISRNREISLLTGMRQRLGELRDEKIDNVLK